MKVYYLLVSAFCFWSNPTQSQFFYTTGFAPFPAPFLPQHPQIYNFAPPIQPQINTYQQINTPSTSSITYNLQPPTNAEYRGFGYRTDYKDGATSSVYFVTGAESELLRNFKDFPNFSRKVQDTDSRGRSLASDILDSNAVPDVTKRIQNLLQPSEFQRLFEQPIGGFVNFYTYPADTVPLNINNNNNGSDIANTTTTTTTETATVSDDVVVDAAESVVNQRFLLNNVDDIEKSTSTTSTTTTTTSTTTNAASSTTESNETATPATSTTTTEAPASTSSSTTELFTSSASSSSENSADEATTTATENTTIKV